MVAWTSSAIAPASSRHRATTEASTMRRAMALSTTKRAQLVVLRLLAVRRHRRRGRGRAAGRRRGRAAGSRLCRRRGGFRRRRKRSGVRRKRKVFADDLRLEARHAPRGLVAVLAFDLGAVLVNEVV